MRGFYPNNNRMYFRKKRWPAGDIPTKEMQALIRVESIRRPSLAGGSFNMKSGDGHAFYCRGSGYREWDLQIRYIKNGRWDGPWKQEEHQF